MSYRTWLERLLSTALLIGGTVVVSACHFSERGVPDTSAETQPNIVLIMADDMGQGDPQIYNEDSKVPTPNIDRLAREGIHFTDAHTPSSVCTPTRYGLLTGRYAWRTRLKEGVFQGYDPALIDTHRVTIASMLKEAGYATGAVGKWHLGLGSGDSTDYEGRLEPSPLDYGFDYFFGIPASLDMPPFVYLENDRVVQPATEWIESSDHRRRGGGGAWRAGPIAPGFRHIDVLPKTTENAVSFIDRQAQDDSNRPFFLYLPFSAPHAPGCRPRSFGGEAGPVTTGILRRRSTGRSAGS